MFKLTDRISINPAFVAWTRVLTSHYANGSESTLEVCMADGKVHQVRHGYGVDVWALKDQIDAARAAQEGKT